MWRELTILWDSLHDAEYLHLLLEPLPVYGLSLGLLFLLGALILRERKSQWLALLILCLSCLSVHPYLDLRREASPRILATSATSYRPMIQTQMERRQEHTWPYLAMASLCGLAMIGGSGRPGKILRLAVFLGGTGLLGFSLWLHQKEAEIHHPNLLRHRQSAPNRSFEPPGLLRPPAPANSPVTVPQPVPAAAGGQTRL